MKPAVSFSEPSAEAEDKIIEIVVQKPFKKAKTNKCNTLNVLLDNTGAFSYTV